MCRTGENIRSHWEGAFHGNALIKTGSARRIPPNSRKSQPSYRSTEMPIQPKPKKVRRPKMAKGEAKGKIVRVGLNADDLKQVTGCGEGEQGRPSQNGFGAPSMPNSKPEAFKLGHHQKSHHNSEDPFSPQPNGPISKVDLLASGKHPLGFTPVSNGQPIS
jgi:hypothetical protein